MVARDSRYQAVLLDAGGTLVGPRSSYGAIHASALAAVGIDRPAEDFERAIRKTIGAVAPGLFHVALERLGVPADAAIHVVDRADQVHVQAAR